MRKLFVAILAFLYITSTTGATLHIHYCMGEPASWGLVQNHSKKCSKCGMNETGKGCCRDENKFLKNNSDQKTTESAFPVIPFIAVSLPPSFVEIISDVFTSVAENNRISHAPPRGNNIALHIRNCVFLI